MRWQGAAAITLFAAMLAVGCTSTPTINEEPSSSTTMPATTSTTSIETTATTTDPPRPSSTTTTTLAAATLATLTNDIVLPWEWGPWTVDDFGYPSQFAVSYDGAHLFGIYPFEENAVLPDTAVVPIGEEELTEFCQERMREVYPDVSDVPVESTVEPMLFFNQPAMLSTCVSPPDGPVEHIFVELFFDRGSSPWVWVELWASNHEWDTIDPRAVLAFAPVFREFVAAHSTGQATTDNPPPPDDAIGQVEPGAMCRELELQGFSYREALAYWMRDGLPDRMDADRNGIPCETVYPAFVVELVYGPPQWASIEMIATTADDGTGVFNTVGPATDAGIVCDTGTLKPFNPDAWGWAESEATDWARASEYTCKDGSGTFVIGYRDHITDGNDLYSTWEVGFSGTGAYEWLAGGGRSHLSATADGNTQNLLIGRIAIHEWG